MTSNSPIRNLIGISWILRLILTLVPQHGYIQPDEFFQFTEPIIGDFMGIKSLKTWEFKVDQPIRSISMPLLLNSPFLLLKQKWLNSYIIMVLPRFIFTGLSFIADYCLYKISKLTLGWQWSFPCLVFSTSYLTLTHLTHTFTNSLETIFISVVLYIVISSLSIKKTKHHHLLGIILAMGIFNRPTFPIFATIPVLFWLSIGKNKFPKRQWRNGVNMLPSFSIASLANVLVDTAYYRRDIFDHFIELLSGELTLTQFLDKTSLIFTPWNFINYNRDTSNLKNHGLHDPFHHMLVNVPLSFGLLGLLAYLEIFKISLQPFRYKMIPARKIMLLSFWISLITLSFIPHQEPRFLLPCLIFLSYLYAEKLRVRKSLFFCWILFNIFFTYIYGFVHQSGVTKALFELNSNIVQDRDSRFDIIFSRTYLPPQTLLNIPVNNERVLFHDLSILDFPESITNKLREVGNDTYRDKVYLIQPSALSWYLEKLNNNWDNISFTLQSRFFPHFTHEDLEASFQHLLVNSEREDRSDLIKEAFSLDIYRINYFDSQNVND
ncbi:GPI mannosyltransferase 4 [Tetranychus urticae]|uniref:Mannosyltransferase n=1 Tax=Tetranychus urticae TaxID=32264 RepID=T1JXA1_TETUR|nr:GPI mannosyltransferase 4 [Tetranychus urticae]